MFNILSLFGGCFLAKAFDNFFAGVDVSGGCKMSRDVKLFEVSKEVSDMSKNVVLKLGSPPFKQDQE